MNIVNDILGIHHVTAIAGDAQANLGFYAGTLGLRLVKKTVNFDDPYTYHLYYGDEIGHPGTLLTFFPWSTQAHRGRKGVGQLITFSFSIPHDAINFWRDRLKQYNVQTAEPFSRFGEEIIAGIDHDGFRFELIASPPDNRTGYGQGNIPAKFAISGFHSVTLSEHEYEPTAGFVTLMLGFKKTIEEGNVTRLETGRGGSGTYIDIIRQSNGTRGAMGVGIVHHVAWRTPSDATQLGVRERLIKDGADVTPVIDRNYFHSIYFHEPGGVLFEVATDPPGFLIDEEKDKLGTNLMLPKQYESYRSDLEKSLSPLHVPQV